MTMDLSRYHLRRALVPARSLHGSFGLHLLHLGLGQADDVVEALAQHVAAGLYHAAPEGAVALEQAAVGVLPHRAAFEDHGVVEQQIEVLLAELLFQGQRSRS